MRIIKYCSLDINNHKIYVAKENGSYVFVGSEDKEFEEIHKFIKGKNINFIEDNLQEFEDIHQQLKSYYEGRLKKFDLSIKYTGTNLQKEVWTALENIPYGESYTYKDIANIIGNKNAIRAVASAIGKNPLLIIIPCHRVLGSDGKLRGYRGGLDVKERLLRIENNNKTEM